MTLEGSQYIKKIIEDKNYSSTKHSFSKRTLAW